MALAAGKWVVFYNAFPESVGTITPIPAFSMADLSGMFRSYLISFLKL
jgi:hypothetical protein